MQAITKYRTTDGTEFSTAEKAQEYENRCAELARIMARLPARPKGSEFSNGHGYLQHEWNTAVAALNDVLTLVEQAMNIRSTAASTGVEGWFYQLRTLGPLRSHPSFVGRVLSDNGDLALNKAWERFMSINWGSLREYDQPYYAQNPDRAEGGRLN